MSVVLISFLSVVLTLWTWASPVIAGPSHLAIVIGNSQYDHVLDLPNVENDTAAVAAEFRQRGYRTVVLLNLPRDKLIKAIAKLHIASTDASQILVYYAGHGFQVSDQNYILTSDVLVHADRWRESAVPLGALINIFSTKPRQKVLFFDACRDNPLYSIDTPKSGRRLSLPAGVLIAFSSQPGAESLDGFDDHSPFANALLAQLRSGATDLNSILRAVRLNVVQASAGQQVPWQRSSLLRKPNLLADPTG